MSLNNATIFMGDDSLRTRHEMPMGRRANSREDKGAEETKTINAGSLAFNNDPIAAKKEEAKKKAMRIISNAFKNELSIDKDINSRKDNIFALRKDKFEADTKIQEIENSRAALKEAYRVDDDSTEEKNLKLLEKEIRANMPGSDVSISAEEAEKIEKIKEAGLTEYQERSLEMLKSEWPYANTSYSAKEEIALENRIIAAIDLERLKSDSLLNAQKQADKIMENASKDILGMLIDEGKDTIDKDNEEQKEQAKEKKEDREILEERIDTAKEKRKENEELTENILDGVAKASTKEQNINAAQQEIKEMMSKMKLIEDDIKGAAIDSTL